jgi:beta-glucanase (GH16 family)
VLPLWSDYTRRVRAHHCLALLLGAALPLVAVDANAGAIRPAGNAKVCLDVVGGAATNGARVQLATCRNNAAQNWTVSGSTLRIFGNKCLDVPDGRTAAGTPLQIWECSNSANQSFSVRGQTLVWTPAKMCVDVPNNVAEDGKRLQTWNCNGNQAQAYNGLSAGAGTDWRLVWADEFNGNQLDRSRWNVEVDCNGGYNNEAQCYVDSTNNINVANGLLTLKVIKQNYSNKTYTSGRINTAGKAHWKYGRFETRLKVPCGQGLLPAAWMLPEPNNYGGWPVSGELDIMEVLGGMPDTVFGTSHFGPNKENHRQLGGSKKMNQGNYCGDFHTYALEWSADRAVWFVDGNAYFTLNKSDGDWSPLNHWPFDQDFHFILNVAMGGNWPGTPDPAIQSASMVVDYVRAYTR